MDYNQTQLFVEGLLKTRLSPELYYHSFEHTFDVLNAALELAQDEHVTGDDLMLLKTAALLHDCGFVNAYHNHEEEGVKIAQSILPTFGYNDGQIEIICGMILKTKFHAKPETLLQKILCDADLDYLGRDDYNTISAKLYMEWKALGKMQNNHEWHIAQINFLQEHVYYTAAARNKRNVKKAQLLEKLKGMAAL